MTRTPIDSEAPTRTLVDVTPHRHRALPLLGITLVAGALLGVAASSRAASESVDTGERGTTLTAVAHVERGVVARPHRSPTSGAFVDARVTPTIPASAARSRAPVGAITSRTPLYALLRVYRL